MADIATLGIKVDTRDVKRADRELNGLHKTSSGATNAVRALASAMAAIGAGVALRSVVRAGMEMERLSRTLNAATGSAAQGAAEFEYISNVTERLGLNLQATAGEYASLAAAAQGTNLQGEQTRRIFEGVATASAALGLSAEQTSGALNAIQQMISKGNVQAEELRGQLGERLPGAFQLAAESMDMTTQELSKALEMGEVMADDLLPRLADSLQNRFGPAAEDAAGSAQAAFNRLDNAMLELRATIAEDLLPSVTTGVQVITMGMQDVEDGADELNQNNSIQDFGERAVETFGFVADAARASAMVITSSFNAAGQTIGALGAYLTQFAQGNLREAGLITEAWWDDMRGIGQELEEFDATRYRDAVRQVRVEREKAEAVADVNKMLRDQTGVYATLEGVLSGAEFEAFGATTPVGGGGAGGAAAGAAGRRAQQDTFFLDQAIDKQLEMERTYVQSQERMARTAQNLYDQTRTPYERLNQDMAELDELLEAGVISWDTYARAVIQAQDGISDKTQESTNEVSEFWTQAARNMENSMSSFFFDVMQGDLDNLAGNFKKTIDRMVADLLASQLLDFLSESVTSGPSSGGGGGGFIGSLFSSFAGSFEGGGFTGRGQRVGGIDGRGGQLAVLHPNETVMDHTKGQSGGTTNVTINVQGVRDEGGLRRASGRVANEAAAALARSQRRNG